MGHKSKSGQKNPTPPPLQEGNVRIFQREIGIHVVIAEEHYDYVWVESFAASNFSGYKSCQF